MTGSLQTQLFLFRLKSVWSDPSRVILIDRAKNVASMSQLGFSMKDVKAICMALTPDDRVAGPAKHDHGKPGEIWVFHSMYKGVRMYLKLWLTSVDDIDRITIISCHQEGLT